MSPFNWVRGFIGTKSKRYLISLRLINLNYIFILNVFIPNIR